MIPMKVCHNRVGPHRQRRPDKSLNLNYGCHALRALSKSRLILSFFFTNLTCYAQTVSPEKGKAATMLPRSGLVTHHQGRIAALLWASKGDLGISVRLIFDLFFHPARFAMNAARRAPRSKGSAGMSDFAVFTADAIKRALGFISNTA